MLFRAHVMHNTYERFDINCFYVLSSSIILQPMRKQGAIILATGGDNSNSAMGKFYEGIMVTGVTTDETDDAVQANIVAVNYKNLA